MIIFKLVFQWIDNDDTYFKMFSDGREDYRFIIERKGGARLTIDVPQIEMDDTIRNMVQIG